MIYGNHLRFRAIEREDLPKFVTWLNDPDVIDGLLLYLPLSLAREENWFEQILTLPADEHPLAIEFMYEDQWIMIGNCGIHDIDWRSRSATIGIFIGEKWLWNKGIGTEVMRLLLEHGFGTLNLHRLSLEVFANNTRAIRAYKKAGFVQEGVKREAAYKRGKFVDIFMMSILRSEWKQAKSG